MSIQDMIKKSVLESGVFDSFNAPGSYGNFADRGVASRSSDLYGL